MSLWRNLLPGSTLQVVVNWINSVLIPRLIGIDSSITMLSGGGGDAPVGSRAAVQTAFTALASDTELGAWADLASQTITPDGDMFVTAHGHMAVYGVDSAESVGLTFTITGDVSGVVTPVVFWSLTGATTIEPTLLPIEAQAQFTVEAGGTATVKLRGYCSAASTAWATGTALGQINTYMHCVQTPV